MASIEFQGSGIVKGWTYTYEDIKAYMDETGNKEITGALKPENGGNERLIRYYHLAPIIGFKVESSGSKITVTTLPVVGGYNSPYPYESYSPTLTIFYADSSGTKHAIGSFGTKEQYMSGSASVTVNNMQNADIYIHCSSSTCQIYEGGSHDHYYKIGNLKLHTHITNPTAPTITGTTGKTITVSGGDEVRRGSGSWYSSPYTFTGLSQGTEYSFDDRKECSCGEYFYSGTTKGKTWNISGSCTGSTTKTMSFKATHTAGTGGDASKNNIVYKLFKSKNSSGTAVATKEAASGTAIKFTGLDPKTKYYCYAYTKNIADNTCWLEGTTKEAFVAGSSSGDVSATTIRGNVTWDAKGSTGVVCNYMCGSVTISRSTSGSYAGFTGLVPGTAYTISYTIKDDEDNTATGSISLTTKKASFGDYDKSTKIIQFSSYSNYSKDTMQHSFNGGSYYDHAQNTIDEHTNLTHNTSYTIKARIKNCFAFDSNGSTTTTNDSEISMTITTDLFSVSGSIFEEHQHRIITLWQTYVNGSARDSDKIDDFKFEFTSKITNAKKVYPYQRSEVTEGSVDAHNCGTTSGVYQTDKKVYSENLKWYYCEYEIIIKITDGYNVLEASVTAHTTFPHAWIYADGRWHKAMGHVYTNGAFVPAPVFVRKNGSYVEPNGE